MLASCRVPTASNAPTLLVSVELMQKHIGMDMWDVAMERREAAREIVCRAYLGLLLVSFRFSVIGIKDFVHIAISFWLCAQIKEQAVLDENGKQQSTNPEIYVIVLPTCRHKLVQETPSPSVILMPIHDQASNPCAITTTPARGTSS
ncbi:hypothetical protein C5167_029069 [Papaver somniferum]|nr:hypothetical protein C5167_029069 [Papaver somniferum]